VSVILELHDVKRAARNVTLTLRTTVSPVSAEAALVDENTEAYAPMYTETPPP
jgi:hypothetical protein